MKLHNRTILITGGSAGIGLGMATKFLEMGNEVIVTGRGQSFLDTVKKSHPKIHVIQSDISDPKQIAVLAKQIAAEFPKLDVLINNAGMSLYKNLQSSVSNLEVLTEELNTNVGGVIRMSSAFMDIMKTNKGTIINVSSALAFVPMPCIPIYCATKAAIHSYTQSLRFQLETTGVEVIEIMPPAVKTDMTADLHKSEGIKMISVETLVRQVFVGFKAGDAEILPGQAKQLSFMRRIAPNFINKQLWKATKILVPAVSA